MLRLVIEINTDLAAFYVNPPEVEALMQYAVHKAMNSPCGPSGVKVNLLDHNGNTAGHATLTEEHS